MVTEFKHELKAQSHRNQGGNAILPCVLRASVIQPAFPNEICCRMLETPR